MYAKLDRESKLHSLFKKKQEKKNSFSLIFL